MARLRLPSECCSLRRSHRQALDRARRLGKCRCHTSDASAEKRSDRSASPPRRKQDLGRLVSVDPGFRSESRNDPPGDTRYDRRHPATSHRRRGDRASKHRETARRITTRCEPLALSEDASHIAILSGIRVQVRALAKGEIIVDRAMVGIGKAQFDPSGTFLAVPARPGLASGVPLQEASTQATSLALIDLQRPQSIREMKLPFASNLLCFAWSPRGKQ